MNLVGKLIPNVRVFGVVLIALSALTACIEVDEKESEGANSYSSGLAPYHVSTTNGTGYFIPETDENVIVGFGCTSVRVYDEYANQVDIDLEGIFQANGGTKYTYVFNDFFRDYSGAVGILYYKSANYNLSSLPLNKEITTPYVTANIYKLEITEDKFFVISSSNAHFFVFDSNLNKIADNTLLGDYRVGESLTLNQGIYYVVTAPKSCSSSGVIQFLEL